MGNRLEEYSFLVYAIAKRYKCESIEWNDLVQSGYLGLIQAINKYGNLTRDHFIQVATKLIVREVTNELRLISPFHLSRSMIQALRCIKKNPERTISEIVALTNLSKAIVLDAISYNELQVIEDYEVQTNDSILDSLEPLTKDIVVRRFYLHKSLKEISIKMNMPISIVRKHLANLPFC